MWACVKAIQALCLLACPRFIGEVSLGNTSSVPKARLFFQSLCPPMHISLCEPCYPEGSRTALAGTCSGQGPYSQVAL